MATAILLHRATLAASAATLLVLTPWATRASAELWWNDIGGLHRVALDGGQPQPVATSFDTRGIAVDKGARRLYWGDTPPTVPAGGPGRIYRSTLEGYNQTPVVTNLMRPAAVALDTLRGHIYFTDADTGGIYQAALTGGAPRLVARRDYWSDLAGLAVDPLGGKLYFTYNNPLLDNLRPSFLARINLDGTQEEPLVAGLVAPKGVALDLIGRKVYYADPEFGAGLIRRANFDGSRVEDVVTGLHEPYGLALDQATRMLYWTDDVTSTTKQGRVQRRHVDGGTVQTLVSELTLTTALAIAPETPIPGDANEDGLVTRRDLAIVTSQLGRTAGATWSDGDFNFDGRVSLADLGILKAHFMAAATQPVLGDRVAVAAIPEPPSLVLAAILGAAGWCVGRVILHGKTSAV